MTMKTLSLATVFSAWLAAPIEPSSAAPASVIGGSGTLASPDDSVDYVYFTKADGGGFGYYVLGESAGAHNLTCRLQQLNAFGTWVLVETRVLTMPSDSDVGLVSVDNLRAGPEHFRFRLSILPGSLATDWEVGDM
jgi:hypothetical protein